VRLVKSTTCSLKKERHGDSEDIRRMLKPTRPHSVHTLLVFLQLLEC
jgi:hypothetical protein